MAAWVVAPHMTENHVPETVTGSENVISMLEVSSTSEAWSAGTTDATAGAASGGTALESGSGAPAAKSELLLSVSVAPPFARIAAVLFVVAGAAAVSKKFAAPQPRRSTMRPSCAAEHGVELPLQPRGAVPVT